MPLSSDSPQRLFFALWPNAAARKALLSATAAAVDEAVGVGARAIPAENLHLTLCFLGVQPRDSLARVCGAAATVRARPLRTTLTQLEYWRDSTLLCATPASIGASSDAVIDLAAHLARALDAVGISRDVKPFRTHLTLARKVRKLPTAPMVPVTLDFDRFALIESRPGRDGSIYSVVDSWHLYIE